MRRAIFGGACSLDGMFARPDGGACALQEGHTDIHSEVDG
jgi:hypothetical protein